MSIDIQTAYNTELTFPFGDLDAILDWCAAHCQGEWRFGDSANGYTFWFESEKDYFTFMIWKK